jgi:protein tyrosine/serine phosphatase
VSDEAARRLTWDGCCNVRDVGGYATEDGATIRWRALLRADSLSRLTPAGRDALVSHGVRTIVDLRSMEEADLDVHPFGPNGSHVGQAGYLLWPVRDPADVELEREFNALTGLLETYRFNLDRCAPRLAAVARAFGDAPEGGVVVHCQVGKDRTGIIVALLLALAGVPEETIAADYAPSGANIRPIFEEFRAAGRNVSYDAWQSPPETMAAFLAHLGQVHGGAEAYLRAGGLTSEEIERVRARLRE